MKEAMIENTSILKLATNDYFRNVSNPLFDDSVWQELRMKAAKQGIPIHGHFELTPRCNLDCKMCYVHLNSQQMDETLELSLDDWKSLIDQSIAEGMIFASLSGGECLISPYFDDIYVYLHSKGIMITILTNGVLLNKKLELLRRFPPTYIQVSVYGNNEEEYENVTGKRCYRVVKENISNAIALGLPIGIAITPSKYLKDISGIIQFYNRMNIPVSVSQWLMPPYSSTGRNIDEFNLSPEEQVEISMKILLATGKEKPEQYEGEVPEENQHIISTPKAGIKCAAGRSDFSISWKGEMSMCVSLSTSTGFPLKEGFHNAWEKTHEAAMVFLMPAECAECIYEKVCQHCPAQHLASAELGHCSKSVCEETKLMIKMGILSLESKNIS